MNAPDDKQIREAFERYRNVIVLTVKKAAANVCLCRSTPTVRHEHPQCPTHVLDERRRMRGLPPDMTEHEQ